MARVVAENLWPRKHLKWVERTVSRRRHFWFGTAVLLLAFGANAVAAFSGNLIARLISTEADRASLARLEALLSTWPLLLSQAIEFAIPTVLIVFYVRPIRRLFLDPTPEDIMPKRRLLNTPLVVALFGGLGWALAFLQSLYLYGLLVGGLSAFTQAKFLIHQVLLGLLTFLICYFGLELLNRRFFIPYAFPEGRLADVPGSMRMSLGRRLFILFLGVGVYPVFVMYMVWLAALDRGGRLSGLIPVSVMVLMLSGLGLILTLMAARAYSVPLRQMKAAVDRIREGNFEVRVPVHSVDELGHLAEGLNAMAAELKEKELIKDTFGRMVAPQVRDHLLRGNLKLGGEVREATVLFADLRGFTELSEALPPDELVLLVNRFFNAMGACVAAEDGLVNKYIGDAMLAVFGAPVEQSVHAASGLRAAGRMLAALDALNVELAFEGQPALRMGIGVHTGTVLAGNIGSQVRMEYTVMGDAVNIASRVEQLTRLYEVRALITQETLQSASQSAPGAVVREIDSVRVKGRAAAVVVYELCTPC